MVTLELSETEALIIFNVLSRREYRIPDALVVSPIVDKIYALLPKKEEPNVEEGKVLNG